jgi:uncharacterized protein YoxC
VAEPIFWLGVSLLLVAVSLTAVLVVALPVLQELGRAARSAEKLFDTLARELPPTLESIRLTGLELSDLTDDIGESVQNASHVVKQVDHSLHQVQRQAQQVGYSAKGLMVGLRAAWRSLLTPSARYKDAVRSRRAYSSYEEPRTSDSNVRKSRGSAPSNHPPDPQD